MALGLLYIFEFDSEKFRHNNLIEVWEEGYIGTPSYKALGASPILKRERGESDGGLYGSSLELSLQSDLDEEFIKLYTTDNKKFQVRHYVDNVLNWSGFILPEKYTEPNIAPPYDVQITVADGLGILKNIDFNLMGRHSILSILKYCLDNTGLALDFEIICDLKETTQDPTKSILLQVTTDVGQWAEKTCYDVLNEIASSFRAMITQHRNRWRFARFADLMSDSMIFTNNLIYLLSLPNIIYNYGNTSKEIYPIGLLTQDILQAYKTCRFTRTFIKRDSFFINPSLKLLENWSATGNVETSYDKGVNYAVLEGTYEGQGISQTIQVEASERAFVLELSYFHKYDAPRLFSLDLTLSDGINTYYLTPDGWAQIAGDPFKFYLDADSIPYTTDSESGSIYKITRGVQKTLVQTGEINFETFPISGNLTISITCRGPQNMGIDQHRGKFYLTGINLSTETPKGIEVKALLSSSSVAASDVEIFFGDTETSDNSDYQIYNDLKFLNGNYTFDWKIGINGTPDSFFNTIIKDYIINLGLSKKSLNGSIQSSALFNLTVLDDQFSGLYYFIDTFAHDLLNDEMSVTLIELIPYMEIASIASEEISESSPEVIIEFQRQPDGTLRKIYTVAGPGTFFKRGAGSTLQDLRDQTVNDLRRISNFSKALAALAQKRADAANLNALAASESAADALFRLNNIVSNNIISREEKAGLKELISRLAQEMNSYAAEAINKGADIEALQTAYAALASFLNDVAKINIDEPTELLSGQVIAYNSLFADFYAKRSVFSTDISEIRSELVSYQNRILSIETNKIRCDAEYTSLHATDLAEAIATALTAAYNEYVTAHGNYKTGLETIIADDKITAEERTLALNLQTIYSDKLSAFNSAAEAAKKSITDSIGTTLSAWTADGVISPLEKLAVKQTRAQVLTEKESIVSDAGVYEISTDAYLAKWTAYDAVLAKYSADSPETITIEADFATTESEYRAAKVAILQAVANVNKTSNDYFQLDAEGNLFTTKNFYSTFGVGCYGLGSGDPGTGGGANLYNGLDKTVTGFALDAYQGFVLNNLISGKANSSHNHFWADITDKPTSFTPAAHVHAYLSDSDNRINTWSLAYSHIGTTGAAHGLATAAVNGFMSAAQFSKLLNIADNANNYSHPTGAGNLHIPAGGTVGQILKNTASGTATWQNEYSYSLPLAASGTRGGVQIGYAATGANLPLLLSSEKGYVALTNDAIIAGLTGGTALQYFRGDKTIQTLNTAAVPELTNLYFTEARVRASVLTGFSASNVAITTADSILVGFNKAQGQINNRALLAGNVAQPFAALSVNINGTTIVKTDADYLKSIQGWFEYDSANDSIRAKKNFYSTSGVGCYGLGDGGSGSGGANLYNGLDRTVTGFALDAYQGFVLKGLVDGKAPAHSHPYLSDSDNRINTWSLAYSYSQIGHLPLSGGTLTNIVNNSYTFARHTFGSLGGAGDVHIGSSGTGAPTNGTNEYGFYTAYNAYRHTDGLWYHSRQTSVCAYVFKGGHHLGGFSWYFAPNQGAAAIVFTELMHLGASGVLTLGANTVYHAGNLLNIGTTASSARTALELTGTVGTHNHNGTHALLAGSASQAFSASTLTMNGALSGATNITASGIIQANSINIIGTTDAGNLIARASGATYIQSGVSGRIFSVQSGSVSINAGTERFYVYDTGIGTIGTLNVGGAATFASTLAVTGITSLGGILGITPGRGAAHLVFTGTDADYGVARIYHTSTNGSGTPGAYTATLALIDQRVNSLSGAYEPIFYINLTGAQTTTDLMRADVRGSTVFRLTQTGAATISSGATAKYVVLENGNNLTWGGVYGAGIPTIVGYNGQLTFYPSGSAGIALTLAANLSATFASSISATNATFTSLATGYLPYKTAGAFGNSTIWTDGTKVDIGYGGARSEKLSVNGTTYFNGASIINGALTLAGALSGVTTGLFSSTVSVKVRDGVSARYSGVELWGDAYSGGINLRKGSAAGSNAAAIDFYPSWTSITPDFRLFCTTPTRLVIGTSSVSEAMGMGLDGGVTYASYLKAASIKIGDNWAAIPNGTGLDLTYNGAIKAKIDSSGNILAMGGIGCYAL